MLPFWVRNGKKPHKEDFCQIVELLVLESNLKKILLPCTGDAIAYNLWSALCNLVHFSRLIPFILFTVEWVEWEAGPGNQACPRLQSKQVRLPGSDSGWETQTLCDYTNGPAPACARIISPTLSLYVLVCGRSHSSVGVQKDAVTTWIKISSVTGARHSSRQLSIS